MMRSAPVRSVVVAERAEATRFAVLTTAWKLFEEKGYFATGTGEIVRDAGVTR